MATLEQLTGEVYERVRSELEERLDAAKAQQAKEIEEVKNKKETKVEQQKVRQEADGQLVLERQKNSYLNELNQELLKQKQDWIQVILDETEEALTKISEEDFLQILRKGLSAISADTQAEIVLGEKSQDQLSDHGKQTLIDQFPNVTFSDALIPNQGGAVIQQAQLDYDLTFKQMIDRQRQNIITRTNQLLEE